jgi:hypothetical protein
VKRIRILFEVPKTVKSSIVEEETCGKIYRGSGARTSEGLPRENEYLHEVVKSNFNPDCWIWRGTWQISMHFGGRTIRRKVEERISEEMGKLK